MRNTHCGSWGPGVVCARPGSHPFCSESLSMKKLIIALGLSCAAITLPGLASAQMPSAQTSKMTQCNADAKTKALNGEARKKFMKECLSAKKK